MELEKNMFWILKGHGNINCPKESERDVLNNFRAMWIQKLKQRSALACRNFGDF